MERTIKEIIEQHSDLHLDNTEDRAVLIDVLTAVWSEAKIHSYDNGYEDGYSEGQSECE